MRVAPIRLSILGALCAVLLVPAQARAHGHLLRARPGVGDTVRVAPRLLRLEFSESPELGVSSIRLVDSLRHEIRLLPLRIDADSARVLIADIAGHLAPGRYTVMWQMAGRDGHPVHGQYDFVFVGDTPVPALPAPVAPAPGVRRVPTPVPAQTHLAEGFDSESLAYVVVRWAHFMGLLVVIGGVAFFWLVLGRTAHAEMAEAVAQDGAGRARRVAIAGAALLGLAAIARLLAQWIALRVNALDPSTMPLGRVVWGSAWGHAWLLEVGALVVAVVGLQVARRAGAARLGWGIAAAGAIGLAWAPALSGHAAVPETALPVVVDVLHVLAAGSWMGALLMLLLAGLPAARAGSAHGRAMMAMVNAFSSTALASAGVVVLTGVLATWRNVEGISALLYSPYGRVLLLKLAVLGVAGLLGLYNWRRARPALAASGDDVAIRRAMRAELAAAAVILLVTAVLVAIPTPANLVSMR
jgi:putative copper export protein/methionine-rich copper-binding protein CopC